MILQRYHLQSVIYNSAKTIIEMGPKQKSHPHAFELETYLKTSDIRHSLVGNKVVDHLDVVRASPVRAASTK